MLTLEKYIEQKAEDVYHEVMNGGRGEIKLGDAASIYGVDKKVLEERILKSSEEMFKSNKCG